MSRPYVRLNVAATADGKIDTFERRGASISSARDKQRVDQLRAASDAVMVGGRTLHDEDPRLTVKSETLRLERQARGLPPNPAKVAVASRLHLRPDCRFLADGPAHIILFTTSLTPPNQLEMLRAIGATVHVLDGARADLAEVLRILKDDGIESLLVEGGATLNQSLLSLGLVDELTVYVAPLIFGGESSPTPAGGLGLPRDRAIPLKLLRVEPWEDGGVLLHYAVGL
ncbi:MAG TPA: dihydrofolate reductase family protein [Anaerolineales bacterium]